MTTSTLHKQIETAFHYRGDVTIHFVTGESAQGFLTNRDFAPTKGEPFIEYFPTTDETLARVTIAQLQSIEMSGEDHAAGKSYQEWLAKKQQAEHAE